MILLAPIVKSKVEAKVAASSNGELLSVSNGVEKTKRAIATMMINIV